MIKIVALLAFAAAASAGVVQSGIAYSAAPAYAYAQQAPLAYAAPAVAKYAAPLAYAPVAKAVVAAAPAPFDPNPSYNYGYSIQDGLTGDSKQQSESLSNGVVQGQYSLVEPDGSVRTVTYTADDVNGFNAVVDRSAPAAVAKVAVAKVAAPVAYAAPAYAHAPVAYAQSAYAHGPVAYHG